MADDNSARYRSNDSFGRGPAAPATDPLAELARLIGRNDPFSEYGRTARPAAVTAAKPAPAAIRHRSTAAPAPPYATEPPHYSRSGAAVTPSPRRYSPEPSALQSQPDRHSRRRPRYAADYPPRAYDDQAGHNDWPVPAPPPAPSLSGQRTPRAAAAAAAAHPLRITTTRATPARISPASPMPIRRPSRDGLFARSCRLRRRGLSGSAGPARLCAAALSARAGSRRHAAAARR